MSVPGIARYPELEKRYHAELQSALHSRGGGCSKCAVRKVHERFRYMLSERLKRDKPQQSV